MRIVHVVRPEAAPLTGAKLAARASAAPKPPENGGFARVLHGLARELDRGEALTARAMGHADGAAMQPGELLALQAGVYRYGEAVDLAAKLVDRAAGAVKTVVQAQ